MKNKKIKESCHGNKKMLYNTAKAIILVWAVLLAIAVIVSI